MRLAALVVAVLVLAAGAAGGAPTLRFSVFARTTLPLGDVVWTGTQFVYVAERTGEIDAGGVDGRGVVKFASLPAEYEEVRCAVSPGEHGWPAGSLFCHGPHGELWSVAADGTVTRFATLPATGLQDGTLAFDRLGAFGYALLAASGGSAERGGTVYAIGPDAQVRVVGGYAGPGGADNIALAPASFGSASRELLLAIDARSKGGRLEAMSPAGKVRVLARFAHGLNPIVAIGVGDAPRGTARPGFYVADTVSKDVYFLPAAQLAPYAGGVLVGDEKGLARFWVVRAVGTRFVATRVATNLNALHGSWNLEGATVVA
ncbi:MAG: hypothetical protein JO064_04080 [Actinobacteria bacterium]|nr:hypothetical protein [Actinomycetota bacterium]